VSDDITPELRQAVSQLRRALKASKLAGLHLAMNSKHDGTLVVVYWPDNKHASFVVADDDNATEH